MLGIRLGGFAKGFDKGYGIGKEIKSDWDAKKKKDDTAVALEFGQTEYDAKVAAGEEQPNDPNGILRYAMPKIVKLSAAAGDPEAIQKANEWVKSDNTKRGTSLFAAGMLKGQNGDMGGAIKDFVQAGRVQGYGADYEITDPVQTEGGGWSVTLKGKDGKEHTQEFKTPDEVLQFGATYLNPEAAFTQWQASQTAKSESARKVTDAVATERGKLGVKTEDKVVRKNLGIGGKSSDMVSARKQALAELQGTKSWDDADEDEQGALIEQRARQILGSEEADGIGEPPKKKIVDTKTGQIIEVTE